MTASPLQPLQRIIVPDAEPESRQVRRQHERIMAKRRSPGYVEPGLHMPRPNRALRRWGMRHHGGFGRLYDRA